MNLQHSKAVLNEIHIYIMDGRALIIFASIASRRPLSAAPHIYLYLVHAVSSTQSPVAVT